MPVPPKLIPRSQLTRPGTGVGMTPIRPSRTDAMPVAPNAPQAPLGVDRNTDTYTYITPVGGAPQVLYNGDREWALLTLVLESAGPVVVGTRSELLPVLSGKGKLLVTNVPFQITIAKTSRLYIAATAVSTVSITIEPAPWLEQITLAAQAAKGGK